MQDNLAIPIKNGTAHVVDGTAYIPITFERGTGVVALYVEPVVAVIKPKSLVVRFSSWLKNLIGLT